MISDYWKALVLMTLASAVLVVAVHMSQAQVRWIETVETKIEGDKAEKTAMGAVSGGLLGGIAAALVGGVGIVAMGTGIGAPAGAGLIALASAIGAGGGALVGAAAGTPDALVYTDNEHVEAAYSEWQWMLLMMVAVVLYVFPVFEFRGGRGRAARPGGAE